MTAEELFQMPSTMQSQTAALPGKTQSADHTLQAMATYYDPEFSNNPAIKLSGAPLCHRTVADAIKERGDVSDKIWLFGLDQQFVMHSVLTNSNNRVVADSWKGKGGKFLGSKGYDDGHGRIIPYVGVIDVDNWFDEYFDFTGGIK